jgi:hypothetical protein
MELSPYYGEQALAVADITVRIRSTDRERINELVAKSQAENKAVTDEQSFNRAKRSVSNLKATEQEIYKAKRAAKTPFEVVLEKIEGLAKDLSKPVIDEQARIIELMKKRVIELEAQRAAEAKKLREKQEAEERAHRMKVRELELQRAEAERKAREAEDALARKLAQEEAARKLEAVNNAETMRLLELEVASMLQEPVHGIVRGGRVAHPWTFKLLNAEQTVRAGSIRLLRIELDVRACNDAVRAQLEIAPDHVPTLPGIEVTQDLSISIKAAKS